LSEAERRLDAALEQERLTGLANVINATGVVLHTNLGRAPLSRNALAAIQEASRYCNLEYDIASGSRGRRGIRVESLLVQLTGAEDALVVNNCAAAALLILSVLAKDGETIVSRGELVEIGGDFRIPDVMATSGTRMIEVGTTNRTHIDDYRRAITKDTRLLMRVHPSNYRIVGFASSPDLSELVQLARESNLPLYEDAGSGQMKDLTAYGVSDEYSVGDLVATGADVVSFSGDKLLGSAQAGLIVGKNAVVNRLRKHPLYRALRIDKLRLAALEASLDAYARTVENNELPVMRMLSLTPEELNSRAQRMVEQIASGNNALRASLVESESAIGGGAGPTAKLKTTAISLTHQQLSAEDIERQLRSSKPPIVARIVEGCVMLDLRTVFPDEEPALLSALTALKAG
jgi:L-seryl-tRNA(Ser) seleniumtransferase